MASRISDIIETHARHAARRAKHASKRMTEHAKTNATLRRMIMILASVACILIAIYVAERVRIGQLETQIDTQTDTITPDYCGTMVFSGNIHRCETTILGKYSATPPIERATICEPLGERQEYLQSLCNEYDNAIIKMLRIDDLAEYGVVPWERDPTPNNGTLRVRTASTPTRISVVCDGKIVANDDAPAPDEDGLYRVQLQESGAGDCKIIVSIAEGSATSKNFVMTIR
ncbi:TPA: hypothetical protein HA251_03950 [Candidatus Woesearchaeota archaeon]|nr:hypothetical protein [Candidatus Woesearchaeota archaeon]